MKTLLLLALMLIFAGNAETQTLDKKWGLGAGLGAYNNLNNNSIGFMPELYLSRYLSSRIDLMLKGDLGLYNSALTSKVDLANVFLDLRLKLSGENNNFRPYLYAGPGFLADNRISGLNFNAGLGAKYYISKAAALKIDLGYIHGIEFTEYNVTGRDNFLKATIGIEFDFGKSNEDAFVVPENKPVAVIADTLSPLPEVIFTVNSPKNIPTERRVRETFPLRNYVFFNEGSTEIPNRYVLLTKEEVASFKEDQLEVFKPKQLTGRSDRQMTVYYNVLNILGDRMQENPSAKVRLTGASLKGIKKGKAMAESVKEYLVNIFGIDASRINTEGRLKPRIPAENSGDKTDIDLRREGDTRVSIASESPELLMEFQSGEETPLKPVEITTVQEAPIDSYVSFNTDSSNEAFSSWSMEIADENGKVQNFGPYTKELVTIPGKSILGTRPEGDYKVTMIGKDKNGNIVKKETNMHMVLWTPPKEEQGMRYSVIYEFDESKVIPLYEKYLAETVTPKIPNGATVIIHGHTDIIGDEVYNLNLSQERVNDVKTIIENALTKAGRNDVKFEAQGFGENPDTAEFDNKLPEGRFYNRNVVVDIIPAK
ncbi:MAG: outer membrane beta-barrel protein [Draconibacterium sp.]|nr:outer membrane beta-barrel protein [Draconibacterium sp.]